jgi:glycine/D-amino acid oxidase-like deaminating enzyme
METDVWGAAGHYMVVGGGLSGTLLAARLVHAGQRVTLFDAPNPHSASNVAAGLINVYTGKAGALTWQAGLMLDELEALFQLPWMQPHRQYLHLQPVYRPFVNVAAYNDGCGWVTQYPAYLQLREAPWAPEWVPNPLGGLVVARSGWLDVPGLIGALKAALQATGRLRRIAAPLPYEAIAPETPSVLWQGQHLPCTAILFAEGPAAVHNPWWPARHAVRPLKGQLLNLHLPAELPYTLVHHGYLAHRGGGHYVAGATYEPRFATEAPDAQGLAHLTTQLQQALAPALYAVLQVGMGDMLSGIRPTSPDRRPMLGRHPQLPLFFFNGMGTKGVLQAPWCTRLLVAQVLGDTTPLPSAIDIMRWKS